jgi:hypothetical protein
MQLITPTQSGYTANIPGPLSSIQEGAKSLFRKDVERNSFQVTVNWTLNAYGYQYIRSFYRGVSLKGSVPFSIMLILNNSTPTLYDALFVPGTFQLTALETETYIVQASLEVTPNAANDAADAAAFTAAAWPQV